MQHLCRQIERLAAPFRNYCSPLPCFESPQVICQLMNTVHQLTLTAAKVS